MISLAEKQQIILRHYHDGESQRKIHRERGCGHFFGQVRQSNRDAAYTLTDSSHLTKV